MRSSVCIGKHMRYIAIRLQFVGSLKKKAASYCVLLLSSRRIKSGTVLQPAQEQHYVVVGSYSNHWCLWFLLYSHIMLLLNMMQCWTTLPSAVIKTDVGQKKNKMLVILAAREKLQITVIIKALQHTARSKRREYSLRSAVEEPVLTSEVTELMLVPSESPFLRYMLTEGLVGCTGQGDGGL